MDFRLIGTTALAGAIAIGAVAYAVGVGNRAGDPADVALQQIALEAATLSAEQRSAVQEMIDAKAPAGLTDIQRGEIEDLIGAVASAAPVSGAPGASGGDALSAGQRAEVEALIRSHLIANPEIIADAITELQARQAEAELTAQTDAITQHADLIFTSGQHVVLGNPDGDVTLVEFFDYNCHFCKRAVEDVRALLESDPNLRVVLKEFPVLGEGSVEAAQVSVAVNTIAPEKFADFHFTLLEEHGQINGARAIAIAEEIGIDPDEINALIESEVVNEAINEVYEIAGNLSLTGTPTFVTADEVVVGAVGLDQLRTKISELRSN